MADLMEMQLGYSRCAAKDRADESSAKEHRTEASRLVVSARAALRLGLVFLYYFAVRKYSLANRTRRD
jgi:hypothetical protein